LKQSYSQDNSKHGHVTASFCPFRPDWQFFTPNMTLQSTGQYRKYSHISFNCQLNKT